MAVPLGRNYAPPVVLLRQDGIPIPFLKHACLPVERGQRVDYVDVPVPLIARMFRMIAVSKVVYRTYANVLKDLVTDWCIQKNK
eukprot:547022-Pelagomonas_calceolata.AAC.1